MDYKEALSYLEGLERFGIQFGLRNISFLLSCLGNPQKKFPTLLIGGTNGKGSVATFLYNILKEKGIKVGLYTSPHLLTLRERIVINGKMIEEGRLAEFVSSIKPYIDKCSKVLSHPTYFEVLTAICFAYFKEEGVEIGVLEVGLGGRLDATNVAKPEIAIITNVGFDHTDRLGNTLERIAREQAGIIKRGVKVITGEGNGQALNIIKETCRKRKASLWQIEEKMAIEPHIMSPFHQIFTLKGFKKLYPFLKIKLVGSYQRKNAALAVGTAELLGGVREDEIRRGLEKTKWPGRIDIMGDKPWFVLDGAHNPPAAALLGRELMEIFPFKKAIFILGILKDKDIKGIVEGLLCPFTKKEHTVIVTQPKTQRALAREKLASWVAHITKNIQIAEDVPSSIKLAQGISTEEDLICVTGSLYMVSDAMIALGKKCLDFN